MSQLLSATEKSLIKRGLEGKINRNELISSLNDVIVPHNRTIGVKYGCFLSESIIDFGLKTKGPCNVVDSRSPTKDFSSVATLCIKNSKDTSISIRFDAQELAASGKVELTTDLQFPQKIKKYSSLSITLNLRVFCTTRIYQLAKIYVSEHKADGATSKFGWGRMLGNRQQEVQNNNSNTNDNFDCFYIGFMIESELSRTIDYDEIEINQLIKKGASGSWFKAYWRTTPVVIVQLDNHIFTEEDKDKIQQQVYQLSKITSPYVVNYIGTTMRLRGLPFCILMEFINNGSISQLIEKNLLNDKFKIKICLDIAKGLYSLHSSHLYHKHLRADAIFLVSTHSDAQVHVKVGNLGIYKQLKYPDISKTNYQPLNDSVNESRDQTGTSRDHWKSELESVIYIPPELFVGGKSMSSINYEKVDIYSFGTLMLYIMSQDDIPEKLLRKKLTAHEFAHRVVGGLKLDIPAEIHPKIIMLITSCHDVDPKRRPELTDIIKQLDIIYSSSLPSKFSVMNLRASDMVQPLLISSQNSSQNSLRDSGLSNNESTTTTTSQTTDTSSRAIAEPHYSQLSLSSQSQPQPQPRPASRPQSQELIQGFSPDQPPAIITSLRTSARSLRQQGTTTGTTVISEDPKRPKDVVKTGWFGEISRDAAEAKLRGCPDGTFLTRWSSNTCSYVLSYLYNDGNDYKHIAGIMPNEGNDSVTVIRADSAVLNYSSLADYIDSMIRTGVVTSPLFNPSIESTYQVNQ